MPNGPQGQYRPADVVGSAVAMMREATGEVEVKGRSGFRLEPVPGDALPAADRGHAVAEPDSAECGADEPES